MNEDDTKDDAHKDGWLSISGIQLTQEDKKVLLEGGWLNDKQIHIVHKYWWNKIQTFYQLDHFRISVILVSR